MDVRILSFVICLIFLSPASVLAKKNLSSVVSKKEKVLASTQIRKIKPVSVAAKKEPVVIQKTVRAPKVIVTKRTFRITDSAVGKPRLTTRSFNQMIDSGDRHASKLSSNINRNIASSEGGGARFTGSVVVAGASKRNPVKYNPLLEEDRVEVRLRPRTTAD